MLTGVNTESAFIDHVTRCARAARSQGHGTEYIHPASEVHTESRAFVMRTLAGLRQGLDCRAGLQYKGHDAQS